MQNLFKVPEKIANLRDTNSLTDQDLNVLVTYMTGKDVVELGTRTGRTSLILSKYVNSLTTVDVFEDTHKILSKKGRKAYSKEDNKFKLIKHRLRKRENVKIIKNLTTLASVDFKSKIDVLFIDADHSYQGVRGDFEAWLNKVKKNGHILLHDSYTKKHGVMQLITELKNDNRVEFIGPNNKKEIDEHGSVTIWKKI